MCIRAFGKEFGGLTQGDNLMGEKGTHVIFVTPFPAKANTSDARDHCLNTNTVFSRHGTC